MGKFHKLFIKREGGWFDFELSIMKYRKSVSVMMLCVVKLNLMVE